MGWSGSQGGDGGLRQAGQSLAGLQTRSPSEEARACLESWRAFCLPLNGVEGH